MQSVTLRIVCLGAALLAPAGIAFQREILTTADAGGHAVQLTARIMLRNGTSRMARLQGVGCSAGICSRTAIRGKDRSETLVNTWLDSLAAICDTTGTEASFVFKDGTRRRLSLVTDFRVLFLQSPTGGTEKLDLGSIRSVEFLPLSK